MVQTSSIAIFATVALCAASPAFAAAVPSKPVQATTTTSSVAAAKTPAVPGQSDWVGVEEKLLADLAALQSYMPVDGKAVKGNLGQQLKKDETKPTTSTSTSTGKPTTQTGKLTDASQKKVNELEGKEQQERLRIQKQEAEMAKERARLQREGQEVLRLQRPGAATTTTSVKGNSAPTPPAKVADSRLVNNLAAVNPSPSSTSAVSTATSTSPATQPQNTIQQDEIKVFSDLERLLGYSPPKSSREIDDLENDVREEEGTWVRGYDNSQNDARNLNVGSGNWVRGYDNSQNDARDLEWVRGYDDSKNDARDFGDDVEYIARDDEPESFEREPEFDDDESYQRYDFEELDDLE